MSFGTCLDIYPSETERARGLTSISRACKRRVMKTINSRVISVHDVEDPSWHPLGDFARDHFFLFGSRRARWCAEIMRRPRRMFAHEHTLELRVPDYVGWGYSSTEASELLTLAARRCEAGVFEKLREHLHVKRNSDVSRAIAADPSRAREVANVLPRVRAIAFWVEGRAWAYVPDLRTVIMTRRWL